MPVTTLICAQITGLADTARYGLSMQLVTMVYGLAGTWMSVCWPDVLTSVLQHDGSVSSDWSRTGQNYRMVLDSIGELGALGWKSSVIHCQYLHGFVFFLKRFGKIPGDRWKILLHSFRMLKIQ
ncbi:MAG: hypothetical protein K8R57_07995 [Verrucomicrobia bacterium]|nr:hypothetical protein [Verrucomicrobiota bacterium]